MGNHIEQLLMQHVQKKAQGKEIRYGLSHQRSQCLHRFQKKLAQISGKEID